MITIQFKESVPEGTCSGCEQFKTGIYNINVVETPVEGIFCQPCIKRTLKLLALPTAKTEPQPAPLFEEIEDATPDPLAS